MFEHRGINTLCGSLKETFPDFNKQNIVLRGNLVDKTLVGYSGFVGSNLNMQTGFRNQYNSNNISEAFLTQHDLVVYCGVRAEKFLANHEPEKDYKHVMQAVENIERMNFKKLVLISTVDVYKEIKGVDENTYIDTDGLHHYGKHRYMLEKWVMENVSDYHILRLPGLFGKNLKKNFIFDMINIIPSLLKEDKFLELQKLCPLNLSECYLKQENGFYKLRTLDKETRFSLKEFFRNCGFNALSFTDSRSIFQFYNLSNLWAHIEIAIKNDIRLLCLATEPISAGELYKRIYGKEFKNEFLSIPVRYDMHSVHYGLFNGERGYIADRGRVVADIEKLIGETQ